MPDGRAANQPDAVTILSPPIGAPLPGAVVSAEGALETVLRGRGFNVSSDEIVPPRRERQGTVEADLLMLARESGESRELFFFPRLRGELRAQLRRTPRLVRFRGLRGCVKQLAGARRWSLRCERLEEQIVEYLRGCLGAEPEQAHCALVVE